MPPLWPGKVDDKAKIKITSKEESDKILSDLEGAEYIGAVGEEGHPQEEPHPAVYHLHLAAGGFPPPVIPGQADHESRPGAV